MRISKHFCIALLFLAQMAIAMDPSILPNEIWIRIARLSGPYGRSELWSTAKWWRKLINQLQRPIEQGGHGLIDTLPLMQFTTEFIPNSSYQVLTKNGTFYIVCHNTGKKELRLARKEQVITVPLSGSINNILENQGYLYASSKEGMVYVIDLDSHILLRTFDVGFNTWSFICIGSDVICMPFINSKNGLAVINNELKKQSMIPVGYSPLIFASFGKYLIGNHCSKLEALAPGLSPLIQRKGMFVIDGLTHELVLEVDGIFAQPSSLGEIVWYPNPSGHLPEDNS